MMTLNKYNLDFEKSRRYFDSVLLNANEISTNLIKLVDFQSGEFFTLLPINTDLKNIHEFSMGGIACGVKPLIRLIISEQLSLDYSLSCLFDNVTEAYSNDNECHLFKKCGIFYKKDIYYSVNYKSVSTELIDECFYASNAIWHSLCFLTKFKFINKKELNENDIQNICLQTQMIMIGAYDDEGYVFWKKNN